MGVYIEKEWLVKRVKKTPSHLYSSYQKFRESTYIYQKNNQQYQPKNSTEVMVKITSSGKNLKAIKNHMDYISRNGEIVLEDDQGLIYQGKEDVRELRDYLRDNGVKIKRQNEVKREYRQTMNIVFSMRDHNAVSEKKLKKAVHATLKKLYPENMYVLAYHCDTNNPHCHVILKIADNSGNRININLYDLQEIRQNFARYLNAQSIEAKAKPFKNSQNKLPSRAVEIIDFGKDYYKHKSNNNLNYFITYKNQYGKNITVWSKTLEPTIKNSKVRCGDKISLKVSHVEKINLPRFNTLNNQLSNQIIINKKHWSIEIIERAKENYRTDPLIEYQRVKRELSSGKGDDKLVYQTSQSLNNNYKDKYSQIKQILLDEKQSKLAIKAQKDKGLG